MKLDKWYRETWDDLPPIVILGSLVLFIVVVGVIWSIYG